ncbi:MAG: hypothetical protein ACP5F9_07360, partial [Thiomonas sp.]
MFDANWRMLTGTTLLAKETVGVGLEAGEPALPLDELPLDGALLDELPLDEPPPPQADSSSAVTNTSQREAVRDRQSKGIMAI